MLGPQPVTASLIFAAGKGSRMKDYDGNKTLLPLKPFHSPFQGSDPILLHILKNLPPGPKGLVVHHKKEEVIEATRSMTLQYYEQPHLNGTGGALLAAKKFVKRSDYEQLIITYGDVPFVKASTYQRLLEYSNHYPLVVLAFRPEDKKQYGVLEIMDDRVTRVMEWTYWSHYPKEKQARLTLCNSGVYATRRDVLARYINILEKKPHKVLKERDGQTVTIEEFFITDLIELMDHAGLKVGYVIAEDETEVMGIDDVSSLRTAQRLYSA
jgi:bifunctional UDP-N-acetylglucosamine pyrophosphorylase/glucosamine-1-phosphate N-acetyltransferase